MSEISAIKTEVNYAFFRKGEGFVDFRLNVEYAKSVGGHVDAFGGTNTPDTIEFRPIFEKTFKNFSVVFGPIVSKALAAPNGADLGGWDLAFANALMTSVTDNIGVNLELHSFMGTFGDVGTLSGQQHYVVPNLDYTVSDNLTLSGCVGLGLTSASDEFTFRFSAASSF